MTRDQAVMIEAASLERRELLVRLSQLYLHDLSAVEGWEVDEWGSFGEDDLDGCWTDQQRHPFVIHAGGQIAGFAIVDQGSHVTEKMDVFDMAEFFILRRWRRLGVGREATRQLLGRFPGRWEVRPFPGYPSGEEFWRRVCIELATGAVTAATFYRVGKPSPMYTFESR